MLCTEAVSPFKVVDGAARPSTPTPGRNVSCGAVASVPGACCDKGPGYCKHTVLYAFVVICEGHTTSSRDGKNSQQGFINPLPTI